jgi:hypothetical protein
MVRRTVVLPDFQILFVPIPKAACTTVLWLLAELAGLPADRFTSSPSSEASESLTVHDINRWPREYRLGEYSRELRDGILSDPGWLRFTIVRHPATRLWSAWLSKLLLREPRFVEAFGAEPWFPGMPAGGDQIVADFRRFVTAVGQGLATDVHWAVQNELVQQLPLNHVGRVEEIGETFERLRAHVGDRGWPETRRDYNRGTLGLPDHAYDADARTVLDRHYEQDFKAFGYEHAAPESAYVPEARWLEEVESRLPALRTTIDAHARLEQVLEIARRRQSRLQAAQQKVERVSAGRGGRSNVPAITNIEGHTDFNVSWAWADGPLAPGMTAVVRVKNEARTLPFSLPPLLRAVDRVVVIDNGSIDGTAAVAERIAAAEHASSKLEVLDYPFQIARCGEEHLATPAASVHSLVHFYNWSFSQVRTAYAMKWDGDMVLTDSAVSILRDLAWQLEGAEAVIKVPRYPLYIVDDSRAFIDLGMRNCEPWGWPNRPGYSFVKAMEWELPLWGGEPGNLELPDWSCVELKHLDGDEFGHWSSTEFELSARQTRKRREWEVFQALVAGDGERDGVEAIDAPAGEHIVDYVRSTWLPRHAAQVAGRSARELARA